MKGDTPEILAALECERPDCVCHKSTTTGKGNTHCPAHNDGNPSLSVSPPSRTAFPLLYCFSGCSHKAVLAALRERGILPRETRFAYGERAHSREDLPDGSKKVQWTKGAKSTEYLYRAEVLTGLDPGVTVLVTEGETAAEAAVSLGFEAVATVCGAASVPTREALTALRGFDVVLVPDNDDPGHRHMRRIAGELEALGIPCRWLDVPNLPEKGDLADFTGSQEALATLVASAPKWEPKPNTSRLRFITARQLSETTPEQPDWLVKGMLARGVITELSAKVKVGKSTFWAHMAAAILDRKRFLGHETNRTPVVLLTEEREASIKELLKRCGIKHTEDLHILRRHGTRGMLWPDIVTEVIAYARSIGAGLLIVDTLPEWAGLRGEAENNTGDALAAMEPLHDAASAGLAVLVVRHDRKGGGELGDSARGASAFGGSVDIILGLRRASSLGHENRRVLLGVGRFDGIPDELTIELLDGEYVLVGNGGDIERQQAREAILDNLPNEGEGQPLSESQVVDRTGKPRSTVRRALDDLLKQGEIVRQPNGAGTTGRAAGYARKGVSTYRYDPEQS